MPPTRTAAAVGLVACALILLQISFTRLISYKLFYHFVFLAIALSLLGLGAAGTYVAVRREAVDEGSVMRRWLAVLAVLTPVAFLAMANFPFTTHGGLVIKFLGASAIKYLAWCSLFMVALNFAGGIVLTQVFKTHSRHMGRLYACDLAGAGFGCLVSVGLMKYLSPPAAFLLASVFVFAALAPFLFTPGSTRERLLTGGLGGLGVIVTIAVLAGPERFRSFENAQRISAQTGALAEPVGILKYEWNHIIRTDHLPKSYVLDGQAATAIVRWNAAEQAAPVRDPAYSIVSPAPRVGIIGFGAGLQVSEARRAAASHIVAIDINPTISRWVLHDDRELNLGLFAAPNIEVITAEGRHAVREQKEKFDVLVMHAIDTYAATAAGAYALTENFLYTKEAMFDYLGAMNPGGVMSIQRWLFNPPRENLRLFATALEAFEELGYADPLRHVIMIAPIADFEGLRQRKSPIWGYLLLSPTPFSDEQVARARAHVAEQGWTALYTPGGNENTPFAGYAKAADREAFRRSYPYIIKPVTDASPYLFQFYDPLHRSAYGAEGGWIMSGIYQSSAVTLLASLGVSIVASLVFIIAPLGWASRRARRSGRKAARLGVREVVFFACLGVGFMALEVPLTQVLALYLGHPVFGFSVVLVALLLSSGAGSLWSQKLSPLRWRVCVLAGILLALTTALIFPFVHGSIQLSDPVRFGLALLWVVLCGLPMGFPLALAVREIGDRNPENVAWAWGVNGAASVIGSCLVMVIAVFGETRYALALGALCYALAAAVSYQSGRATEATP